ncbi:BTB/POZ and MATH domain-containing protein 1-like [Hordeum vulgare subsp. vulgare]|uniref:BTB domain-containing protein n=1 Tax=Hordeum vulgare subsp. vulgare TaxID=112509 RepID=A0A8I7BIL1_HORVV|nr:BTB/POZ and MATH domain-containing protein 1-like [Hordeum vulgare subsp. vulgare]
MVVDSIFADFILDPKSDVYLSQTLGAGEHVLRIGCHPRGTGHSADGDLSVALRLQSKSRSVKAEFEAFLTGGDDGEPPLKAKRSTFTREKAPDDDDVGVDVHGWFHFRRGDVDSLFAAHGAATLVCGAVLVRGDDPVPVPASDIGDHLRRLLDRADGSDVSFSVAGETFRAHRAVLAARSPVFRAELFGSMAEAAMPCITLRDIEPSTFRVLLRFMYTDGLPTEEELPSSSETTELFQRVLAAADRYDLGRLKLLCAQRLWQRVSVETVATTLGYAEMHSCPELKKRCLDFFMADKNFKKVVVTDGYLWLIQRFPSIIYDIRARVHET